MASLLEGQAAETGCCGFAACHGKYIWICVDDILIKMGNIVVPGGVTDVHVIAFKKVFKGLLDLRVYYCTELIDSKGSTIMNSASLRAV